jgi:hypothetical protein
MQHIRIAIYDLTPKGVFANLAKRAERDVLPVFAQQPGFLRYGLASSGRQVISVSLWETEAEATAANAIAADWVRANIADQVTLKSTYVGDLAFFGGEPTVSGTPVMAEATTAARR